MIILRIDSHQLVISPRKEVFECCPNLIRGDYYLCLKFPKRKVGENYSEENLNRYLVKLILANKIMDELYVQIETVSNDNSINSIDYGVS